MKAIKSSVVLGFLAMLATNGGIVNAAPVKAQATKCSPKEFVQSFYNWYVFKDGKEPNVRGIEVVLSEKKQAFDAPLYNALSEDLKASQKSKDEVVGLDFDPFINSQAGPSEKYVAGPATSKGPNYIVPMYGVDGGKKSAKPVIQAEVSTKKGHCVFSNFHYEENKIPENENLVSILSVLRKDRVQPAK